MANNTYVALDKVTVTSATPSITFNSIPQTYSDLVIVAGNVLVSNNGYSLDFKINADTGSNYSLTNITANSSGSRSDRVANGSNTSNDLCYYYGFSSTVPGQSILNFMNYSSTDLYKTILTKSGATDRQTELSTHLWRSNSAITTIEIGANGSNIAAGTTFSLYGIRAEGTSPTVKATGGIISSDTNYYYHTFSASGTFTPTESITADVLVVAGGGGGGGAYGTAINSFSGGGGAGGFYSTVSPTGGGGTPGSSLSLTATGYSVTVGAGGAGGVGYATDGANGSNSVFSTVTAIGGGGGGGGTGTNINDQGRVGKTGGSGGGAGASYLQNSPAGGSGTTNQGYAGGAGTTGQNTGGGGGAGSVGYGGSTSSNGGDGLVSSLNLAGTYLAGGGGGARAIGAGSGGLGGGGNAGDNTNGSSGTANTGGGGGGCTDESGATTRTGGAGGSGLVVIRYAK
jgi:hypothetical protein